MLKKEKWGAPNPSKEFHKRFEETINQIERMPEKKQRFGWRKGVVGGFSAAAAGAALFLGVCAVNPVWAEEIPLLGGLFKQVSEHLSFQGDFEKYAEPVVEGENTAAADKGVTLQVSETYSNGAALYVSFLLKSEEPFAETALDQQGNPILILNTELQMDGSEKKYYPLRPEGKFLDFNTYAGVLRLDAADVYGEYKTTEDFPEKYEIQFCIDQIEGALLSPDEIDTGYTQEELAAMPDEEFSSIMQEAMEKGGWNQHPNAHENWWIDGSWTLRLDVEKNTDGMQTVEINETNEAGIGIGTITATPFEIRVEEKHESPEQYGDTILAVFDADGELLDSCGAVGGNARAIGGKDISTVSVYLCDYIQYMDELKPLYYNGELTGQEFQKLLEEKALYKTQAHFENPEAWENQEN